jgi:branched-chain amino acid aminotransferase
VTAIGSVESAAGGFVINGGEPGAVTGRLRERLVAIQQGRSNDPHNWVHRVEF